jgi:membrane-bound lytic murein transglycosylase D
MIRKKLQEYGIPRDLEIVPLVESGYTDYYNPKRSRAAGLWAFIPQTARRYDMRVDDVNAPNRVDDRLDEEKETIAAARYFRDLYTLFQDWRLALRGYNEGESHVSRLIMDYGTRDAWELERQSESKEHYLAKITAALLIYKNPGLLE